MSEITIIFPFLQFPCQVQYHSSYAESPSALKSITGRCEGEWFAQHENEAVMADVRIGPELTLSWCLCDQTCELKIYQLCWKMDMISSLELTRMLCGLVRCTYRNDGARVRKYVNRFDNEQSFASKLLIRNTLATSKWRHISISATFQ
jgi:hypothetical protein